MKIRDLPLIPGYVFVRVMPNEVQGPVVTTPGVTRLVGFGKQAASIEDAEIERLRAVAASPLKAEPWPYLPRGSRVRIVSGSFAGMWGTLLEVRNQTLLILSIEMLNRSIAVHIDSSRVEPVVAKASSELVGLRILA
jgi:transcriptional antiterminator RfaH